MGDYPADRLEGLHPVRIGVGVRGQVTRERTAVGGGGRSITRAIRRPIAHVAPARTSAPEKSADARNSRIASGNDRRQQPDGDPRARRVAQDEVEDECAGETTGETNESTAISKKLAARAWPRYG
jgi:hypothetical protein